MSKAPAHPEPLAGRFRRAADGDKKERRELAWENAGLVLNVATYYAKRNPHLDMDDLIQEGRCGIMHSLARYDVDKGWRFSTYATFWIRHFIQRYVVENHSCVSSMKKDTEMYMSRRMTDDDRKLYEMRCIQGEDIDKPLPSGDLFAEVLEDKEYIGPEEQCERAADWEMARRILNSGHMTELQRGVVCMHFGLMGYKECDHAEIAKWLGCSSPAVERALVEALSLMQSMMEE